MIIYYKDGREPESYRGSDYDIYGGFLDITFKYEPGGIIIPMDDVDHIEVGAYFEEKSVGSANSVDGGAGIVLLFIIFALVGVVGFCAIVGIF